MYGGLLLDTILYTVLMFFCCTVALVLMLNECENVRQMMETAAMQHTPLCYLYTIPPHHLFKPTYLLIHIKYWYRKVEKHIGGVECKKYVINS